MSNFERVLSDDWLPIQFKSSNEVPVLQRMINQETVKDIVKQTEQAVLQSLEIQELRKDAKRLDWLESCEESHGFYHAGYGDYLYYAHQEGGYPSVREVIDTAMEEGND